MPNRFLRYLQEAGTDLRRFDATDPELMRGFLEWTVWDVRRQPTARARHALAVELALECLEVVAGPAEGRLTVLPTDFLDQIQKCLDVHKNIRAGMRPGMSEAYAWAMDYVCAALLGWPKEAPLNAGVDEATLKPWQSLARNLVFQRVNDACERCRRFLEYRVIGFGAAFGAQKTNWAMIAQRIVNRLVSNRLWLAWTSHIPGGKDPANLRGNVRSKHHTRMTQHSVTVWIPEELINKKQPEGETFTFFSHVDRAIQGFCTKYTQKYRYHFVGGQFKAGLLPTGMLWPFLQKAVGLELGQVCVWQSSLANPCPNPECSGWKTDNCANPACTFTRTGPMRVQRGRLLLASGGRFELRQAWRCDNPTCSGHGDEFHYFFGVKCQSQCRKTGNHDCCPLCGKPHSMGRANRTIAVYDYLQGAVLPAPPPPPPAPAPTPDPKPAVPPALKDTAPTLVESAEEDTAPETPGDTVEVAPEDEDDDQANAQVQGAQPASVSVWATTIDLALTRFQHDPAWVSETINAVTELKEGQFPRLKALLRGVEVDWEDLYHRVADGLKAKKQGWSLGIEEFRKEFNQRFRDELFNLFDCQLSSSGYDLEELALHQPRKVI